LNSNMNNRVTRNMLWPQKPQEKLSFKWVWPCCRKWFRILKLSSRTVALQLIMQTPFVVQRVTYRLVIFLKTYELNFYFKVNFCLYCYRSHSSGLSRQLLFFSLSCRFTFGRVNLAPSYFFSALPLWTCALLIFPTLLWFFFKVRNKNKLKLNMNSQKWTFFTYKFISKFNRQKLIASQKWNRP
jgi:hypothetical protein